MPHHALNSTRLKAVRHFGMSRPIARHSCLKRADHSVFLNLSVAKVRELAVLSWRHLIERLKVEPYSEEQRSLECDWQSNGKKFRCGETT